MKFINFKLVKLIFNALKIHYDKHEAKNNTKMWFVTFQAIILCFGNRFLVFIEGCTK